MRKSLIQQLLTIIIIKVFKDQQMLHNLLTVRSLVLGIPDVYNFNDPELIIEFEKQIDWVRAFGGKTSY